MSPMRLSRLQGQGPDFYSRGERFCTMLKVTKGLNVSNARF